MIHALRMAYSACSVLHSTTLFGDAAYTLQWGKVVIADTRAEALVQRDHHGPVASRVTARVDDGGESIVETEGTRYGISRRWGVGQPVVVAEYQALTNCIFDLEWMEDDRRIALACGDGKCRVQDTETQAEVLPSRLGLARSRPAGKSTFERNGMLFVTGSENS